MKKAWKYIVAVLIGIVGVFMLGMISGDNETAALVRNLFLPQL